MSEEATPFCAAHPRPLERTGLPGFPLECLPAPLRVFVEQLAVHTQTPPDLGAVLSLMVVAISTAGRVRVDIKRGYSEPVNLYAAVVLPPGSRKSAVASVLLRPVFEHERKLVNEAVPAAAKAEAKREVLERRLSKAKQKAASDGAGEAEMALVERLAVELSANPVQTLPRLIVDDITPEKLVGVLESNRGRIGLVSTEGGPFAMMAGRYSKDGSSNLDVYLKSHCGDPLRTDRVTRDSETVDEPALTLGVTVQPGILAGLADKQGFRVAGLLARILFSVPESRVGRREADPPSYEDAAFEAYADLVEALLEFSPVQEPLDLRFSDTAREAFVDIIARIEAKLGPGEELDAIADWGSKLHGAIARIAGLLHMADNATCGEWSNTEISEQTLRAAEAVGKYFAAHAICAFEAMGADPALEDAKYTLNRIRVYGRTELTKRELFTRVRGRIKRVPELDKAIEILVEAGYLLRKTAPGRSGPGRPSGDQFEVHPSLFDRRSG